jgi:hypothetical protein
MKIAGRGEIAEFSQKMTKKDSILSSQKPNDVSMPSMPHRAASYDAALQKMHWAS